jgi:hypothetical protein
MWGHEMSYRKLQLLFVGVVVCLLSNLGKASTFNERNIAMAEESILWALISSRSLSGKHACIENQISCADDRAILAITILGVSPSVMATKSLVGLLRYTIDADLGETHTCYLLSRGGSTNSFLRKIDPSQLMERCLHDVKLARMQRPLLLEGVSDDFICAGVDEISRRRDMLLKAMANKRRCSDMK